MGSTSQEYVQTRLPATATIAGILMIVAGILGFIDSYLILASVIIFGWLIVGLIGLFSLGSGVGLMMGSDWSYSAVASLAVLNLFVGFIEMIGAFNFHYAILGWVGIGEAIGVATLVVSAAALYLISRGEVKSYFGTY